MQLNPSEISDLIKSRIENFDASAEARNTGTIVSLQDGIVRIHGLSEALLGEMLGVGRAHATRRTGYQDVLAREARRVDGHR